MLCALTVRRLKPGTFEEFKGALRSGPIWPDPDAPLTTPGNADAPVGVGRASTHPRNVEDENEVITLGFVGGSLEELRARQRPSVYGQRPQPTDPYVESKVVDGVYEVLVECSFGLARVPSPYFLGAQLDASRLDSTRCCIGVRGRR